jgi:hypothetical protein
MKTALVLLALVSSNLALLVPTSARCQSLRGQLGPQSRASIRISVSVAPRFMIKGEASSPDAPRVDAAGAGRSDVQFASNAPGMRYTVIAEAAPMTMVDVPDATERRSHDLQSASKEAAPPIFIVVPD